MTTAPPAQATPSASPLPDVHGPRLVGDTAQDGDEGDGHVPLVGRLVRVPEGTNPARRTGGGAIRIDSARHAAKVDGHELDLTYLEFGLLAHLVLHPHQVHSRERLMAAVWGYDHIGDGRTVDVHISRLRHKLGRAHRTRIVTVRRVGYKYVPDQQENLTTPPCRRP
ncbi:hypothetical protein JCM4814A_88730 [Streptomyces phaeofaciens JCM 4814]|uniref:OmpR/PhoB-type domain-containing protein n=1 Tax=Streptomyces phaeofaciens TaxID=68254 RepID=A0A918LXU4_9ACTN|nr:winged helix-turn-helix domain-containing protein [Streptomyces phaeofaciens]GGT70166.1 hypothetical protein GCM10010226_54970 [Streptomyces phaeofaciens]